MAYVVKIKKTFVVSKLVKNDTENNTVVSELESKVPVADLEAILQELYGSDVIVELGDDD